MATPHASIGKGFGAVWALALVLAACGRVPAAVEPQAVSLSEAEGTRLGRASARQVEQLVSLAPDLLLQTHVRRVGEELAAATDRPSYQWSFAVLDDPMPSAFSLPGGHVYLTRGLMAYLASEAQLAFVLAHEIAHVTEGHPLTGLSRGRLTQISNFAGGVFFPGLARFGGWTGLGLDLLFQEYGREAELAADALGVRYALQREYDIRDVLDLFRALESVGRAGSQTPLPSWFESHPSPSARLREIEAHVAPLRDRAEGLRSGRDAYHDRIDGLVYGENPRDGFFRDRLFLHPELGIQLEVPGGWRTEKLRAAMVATSPGRNAVSQLTLVDAPSAAEASSSFLAQRGVYGSETRFEIHNGIPGVVSTFRADGEQGPMRGLVAFLVHEGRILRLLSYTSAILFRSQESVFRQTLRSFTPILDPDVLGVQPRRIRVMTLPEDMTASEFHQRFPSDAPLQELLLLNQLSDSMTSLAAGTRLKRVLAGEPASASAGAPAQLHSATNATFCPTPSPAGLSDSPRSCMLTRSGDPAGRSTPQSRAP